MAGPSPGITTLHRRFPTPRHESGILCKTHKIYSLSCADFDALWKRSGGRCEACGFEPETARRGLVIDHDHRYGNTAVRGLICRWCNAILGQIEGSDAYPSFGRRNPSGWFRRYFERPWFLGLPEGDGDTARVIDRKALRNDLREWGEYNRALYSANPKMVLVPTDKPSEIAKILRAQMSPQAFGSLVRILNREAQKPKRMGGAQPDR